MMDLLPHINTWVAIGIIVWSIVITAKQRKLLNLQNELIIQQQTLIRELWNDRMQCSCMHKVNAGQSR